MSSYGKLRKRLHLAIACKRALTNYSSPSPPTAAVDAKRDAGSIRQLHEKDKKNSESQSVRWRRLARFGRVIA